MRDGEDKAREGESRRIIESAARQTSAGDLLGGALRGVRDHVSASDVDRSDSIELWGSRIGRALGLLITLGMILWLFLFIVRGA